MMAHWEGVPCGAFSALSNLGHVGTPEPDHRLCAVRHCNTSFRQDWASTGMNYRHAFHAGNFADVIKHVILTLTIAYLKKKPKPFRVIDTHAGCGLYDLLGDQAVRTNEWQDGIGRLLNDARTDGAESQPPILQTYLDVIRQFNDTDEPRFYPGSPMIARHLLRSGDRLIVNELHPEDVEILRANVPRRRNTKVMSLDAWSFLKSALPPPERRGVILIDPPFEQPGEFERMVLGLTAATKRFATGIYLLWYPLKHPQEVERFKQKLRESGLRRLLAVEVFVAPYQKDVGLTGTGLLIHNPPFELHKDLANVLPYLTNLLATHPQAKFEIDVLAGE